MMITFDPIGSHNKSKKKKVTGYAGDKNNVDKNLVDIIKKLDSDDGVEAALQEEENKFTELYTSGFDMQAAIAQVPDLKENVAYVIKRAKRLNSDLQGPLAGFGHACMNIIEKIVAMDKKWGRWQAIVEAAKELLAVSYAQQSTGTCQVHLHVLNEFINATDDEYRLLKKSIFG